MLTVVNPGPGHRLADVGVSPLAQHDCVQRHVKQDNFRVRRLAAAGKSHKRQKPLVLAWRVACSR